MKPMEVRPGSPPQWCHVFCYQWLPETYIDDIEKMEPVKGYETIPKDRFK